MIEPSQDVADALRLVLLYFSVKWSGAEKKEWERITGNNRATSRSLCNHTRMMLDVVTRPRPGRPCRLNKDKTLEATKPWALEGVSRATWYNRRRREKDEARP